MTLEYILKRSNRKTLSVEVTQEAAVLVRAPLDASKAEIEGFLRAHMDWILKHLEKQRARSARMPALDEEKIANLKAQAKTYLPQRVAYFGALMGLAPSGVKITSAEKRFGSCSAKNSLCFSWRLMLYPSEAIDYVVVHELAHIRHKNHGRAFYECVAKVLPDYKQRRALLK